MQLTLPNTIDVGSEITAGELQSNFEAVRTLINGNLEGGASADGNIKANGITARELTDQLLVQGLPPTSGKEGLANNPNELKVTPGAGLILNYAAGTAWVRDDSGVLAMQALIPVTISVGASVTVAGNSSGNPRYDQIILTMTGYGTGTVSVLQGTPTAGATLANRDGGAALPVNAILLADVLVANGAVGPFVAAPTSGYTLRDRRPWSKPMVFDAVAAAFIDVPVDSMVDNWMKVEYAATVSVGSSGLRMYPDNISTSVYSLVRTGLSVNNVGGGTAVSLAETATNNGLSLAGPSTAWAAGGLRIVGNARLQVFEAGGRQLLAHASVGSLIGSSNQVVEIHDAANHMNYSGIYSLVRFVSAGTITGRFIVERI